MQLCYSVRGWQFESSPGWCVRLKHMKQVFTIAEVFTLEKVAVTLWSIVDEMPVYFVFRFGSDDVSCCLQVFFSSAKGGSSCQIYFMTLNKPGMANWWLPQLEHNHITMGTIGSRTEPRNTLELVSQSSYSKSTLLLVPWNMKCCWGLEAKLWWLFLHGCWVPVLHFLT